MANLTSSPTKEFSGSSMHVIKRNGTMETMRFDRISDRIIELGQGLDVDAALVTMSVINGIKSGMSTAQIDTLAAETAYCLSTYNPDYDTLAGRMYVSNLHKSTSGSYAETLERLASNKNVLGQPIELVDGQMREFALKYIKQLESAIVYANDYTYTYFGLKTLERSYLQKDSVSGAIIERPQHMLMRVSLGIHYPRKVEYEKASAKGVSAKLLELDALERTLETYHGMSVKKFTHATPTLFNSGTRFPSMSSCYLLSIDDDLDHILETLKRCAKISKFAGGLGLNISDVRCRNSLIRSTNGASNGIIPMIKMYDQTGKYVNQGGKRNGSIAMFLEPWHGDIMEFLDLRLNDGGQEDKRAKNMFIGMWIPDLFMKRVKAQGIWSLMCPDTVRGLTTNYGEKFEALYLQAEAEGKYVQQLPAADVWRKILESQINCGLPYMLYKDHVNRKSNHMNIGTIKGSNLCVAPETEILTEKGWAQIGLLNNIKTKVWNGQEWSETTIKKTGEGQKLLRVSFSNGEQVECTEYHKFPIVDDKKPAHSFIQAIDLKKGMKLLSYKLPVLEGFKEEDLKYPYTAGFFSGKGKYKLLDGTRRKIPSIRLEGEKKGLVRHIFAVSGSGDGALYLAPNISPKYTVPINATIPNKVEWLAGLCDASGSFENDGSGKGLIIDSPKYTFLRETRLMLQTIGIDSKIGPIHQEKSVSYGLKISPGGVSRLLQRGFATHHLDFADFKRSIRNTAQIVQISAIEDLERVSDTYCFTESKRSMGMFNGILLGNCVEVVEFTDKDNVAVCNLANISLPYFAKGEHEYDYQALGKTAELLTVNLNRVIDYGMVPLDVARETNNKQRAIAIGVQGKQEALYLQRAPWESKKAQEFTVRMAETIYYHAVKKSAELGLSEGSYHYFQGSPISQGILQCDLWGVKPVTSWDWDGLREKCRQAMRNSLLVAYMPTAATAQIMGNTESFECATSNLYSRKVLAGEFPVTNRFLYNDLKSRGLWSKNIVDQIIANNGSIQAISAIPDDLKRLYLTVWEIPQKVFVDLALLQAPFIDQTQSFNVSLARPTIRALSSLHMYSWEKGAKTGSYYIRSQPARDAVKFTIPSATGSTPSKPKIECTDEICLVCQ